MAQIKITIPDEIYKQLKESAEENVRTLGEEVAFIAKQYFANQIILNPPMFIPHDTPGGITTPPVIEPYKIICDTTPNTTPGSTPTHTTTIEEELAIRAEQIKEASPAPMTPRKFIRPDGEPFELKDFEQYLAPGVTEDDTYKTLKKKIPSLQFTTILREGASRPLDDFVKYLKEEFIYTIENALGYSPAQNMPQSYLRQLAEYLTPHIPE